MKPISFADFAKQHKVELTPGQSVVTSVAFDRVPIASLTPECRAIAQEAFGDVEDILPSMFGVVVVVAGARGGKSFVFVAMRLLHLALTVPLDSLGPGEHAFAILVGPDQRLGRQALRYAVGLAENHPRIVILARTEDSLTIQRENGRAVTIEVLPASRGGSSVRGRSLVGAAMDECAFFRDANAIVNDEEIFKALAPRIMPQGQLIISSTPWAEAGLLYDLFVSNFGHPETAIAVRAPTTLLRNDEHTLSMVKREEARDGANAQREFFVQFMAHGAGFFFDAASIDAALTVEVP